MISLLSIQFAVYFFTFHFSYSSANIFSTTKMHFVTTKQWVLRKRKRKRRIARDNRNSTEELILKLFSVKLKRNVRRVKTEFSCEFENFTRAFCGELSEFKTRKQIYIFISFFTYTFQHFGTEVFSNLLLTFFSD